jgi:hypothetical protein
MQDREQFADVAVTAANPTSDHKLKKTQLMWLKIAVPVLLLVVSVFLLDYLTRFSRAESLVSEWAHAYKNKDIQTMMAKSSLPFTYGITGHADKTPDDTKIFVYHPGQAMELRLQYGVLLGFVTDRIVADSISVYDLGNLVISKDYDQLLKRFQLERKVNGDSILADWYFYYADGSGRHIMFVLDKGFFSMHITGIMFAPMDKRYSKEVAEKFRNTK